jgi:3-phosphoinositide dependent protein kinase-1
VTREKTALLKLKNVNGVITLFCTFQSPTKLFFVLTLARNGDLLKYINRAGSLPLECAKFYAAELLIAIEGMHSNSVIHRDLKPENLLLDDRMHLLVTDFGSSKILADSYDYRAEQADIEKNRDRESDDETRPARQASFVGTAQYVSPEVLNGDAIHPACDLFSFGSIIYQMLCGKFAFSAPNEYLTFQKILKLDYKFSDGGLMLIF